MFTELKYVCVFSEGAIDGEIIDEEPVPEEITEETTDIISGRMCGKIVSIPPGHRWYACCKAALDAGETEAEYSD